MATMAEALAAAVQHHQAGRLVEAEALYQQILVLQPQHTDALHLLGVIAQRIGRHDAAIELIGKAITINYAVAQYHSSLGDALASLKRGAEAAQSYRGALDLDPTLAIAHQGLGNILYLQGDYVGALACFRSAAAFAPGFAEAHSHLGDALFQQGELEAAVVAYRRALALRPDLARAHANLGLALVDLGQLDAAVEHCRRSIALKPNFSDAHNNLALALLLQGQFAEGWLHHEWRWRVKGQRIAGRRFDRLPWCGAPLNGARILLHAEQGLGDTLQFVRYAPLVAARGGRVLLEVQPALRRLVGSIAAVEQVIGRGEPLPAFAEHCPLLSLPLAFGTELAAIPSEVPYLRPDAAQVEDWDARLKARPGLHVGLVWGGQPEHRRDRARSIPLAAFAPLGAAEGVIYYSLQKGPAAVQAASPPAGLVLHDIAAMLGDFADTAAAIAALDLVITVDTSVAHVAGAIGKAVWILLPHVPDWRWLLGRADSPWYPSARLFRQPSPGAWAPVIARVAAELSRLSGRGSAQGSLSRSASMQSLPADMT